MFLFYVLSAHWLCLNQKILSTPVYLLHGDKRVTKNHGQADRTANKLSIAKIELSYWCTVANERAQFL